MLKLSTKGRYGLRAMIDLAMAYNESHTPIMMSEIAERQALSRKYLHALLTPLKNAGLVKSARGAKGGYYLSKSPSEITIGEILETLEGEMSIVDCISDAIECDRSANCLAKGVWEELNQAIVRLLNNVTLHTLICNGTPHKENQL